MKIFHFKYLKMFSTEYSKDIIEVWNIVRKMFLKKKREHYSLIGNDEMHTNLN